MSTLMKKRMTSRSPAPRKKARLVPLALPSAEQKYFDTNLGPLVAAATGAIYPSLVLVPQGVRENERIGRKLTLSSIALRFYSGNTTNTNEIFRVIVYQDKQCNGAAAVPTDILSTGSVFSFNNLFNKNRFRVLREKTVRLTCDTTTAQPFHNNEMFIKCNIPVEYSAGLGAITELRSNNIGILIISLNGNVSCDGIARVRYLDN